MGNRVAIVTGGSSGIGRCTATALAQSGCVVYELSRRDIPLKGVKHLNTDVTDEISVTAAINQIAQEQGKIDIVVIAQGLAYPELWNSPSFRMLSGNLM